MKRPQQILGKLVWMSIIALLTASILPNVIASYWFFDLFAHFKVQYLFLAILLLPIAFGLLKKKRAALILLVISLLWNGYYILPYYLGHQKSIPLSGSQQLQLLGINLLSSNTKIKEVQQYIETNNPDILVLLEFTPQWQENLKTLTARYPYKKLLPRTDNFGIAVLSKTSMKFSVAYFGRDQKPSIIGNIGVDSHQLTLIATHPVPPINQVTFENRNKQLGAIVAQRDSFSKNLVLIGDLNTSSFSNTFNALLKKDLRDSRIGFGLLPTWPAHLKLLQTTLDHCLVSSSIHVKNRSVGKNIGSDHLPINITIEF